MSINIHKWIVKVRYIDIYEIFYSKIIFSGEEISSIFERFRQYLMINDINLLVNEFNHYRTTWSTNKFRMFLTNVLVVMRTWADSQQQIVKIDQNEDWDAEETTSSSSPIAEKMKASAHYLFISIVDCLQLAVKSGQTDRMLTDVEFDMWKRIVTNKWTINEKVYINNNNIHQNKIKFVDNYDIKNIEVEESSSLNLINKLN